VKRAFLAHTHTPRPGAARLALASAVLAMLVTLPACGGKDRGKAARVEAAQVNTIGVNAFLWRAALETASFAPLVSADSAGGVIITDWYTNPANPGERVKLTIAILDQDLRADALRVNASRQVTQGGGWVDAPVQAATVQKLEDIILTKARDLRRQAMSKG
jgi:hypothetical protein